MNLACSKCGAENDEAATCFTCGAPLLSAAHIVQGTVLADRYEIRARLGRGGMGAVYRALDRVLAEEVALKVMRPDRAAGAKRFRQEIRLARRVVHRNVGRIYEYGEDQGLSFISMELVEGVDLERLIRERGAFGRREAFQIALQVTRGLAAIHGQGIIHRDLKTANLMLDRQGVVRLMDFGIAKELGGTATTNATATGQVVGTPDCMSPEQARGVRDLDVRSDLYSLGVVIFKLFTGEVPFQADSPLAVLMKHVHDPPPLDTGPGKRLPQALRPVLARALAKSPDERYGSAGEMQDALRQAQSEAAAEPVPPNSGETLRVQVDDETVADAAVDAAPSSPTEVPEETWLGDAPTVLDTPTGRPGWFRPGPWLTAGLSLALVALIGWLAAGWRAPQPGIEVDPAVSTVAAATIPIRIDALPWAHVVLTPRQASANHGPREGLTTPVALELPAGEWRVALSNGGLTSTLEATITVGADSPREFSFTMPGYDPGAAVTSMNP